MYRCRRCGKGAQVGMNVSHSHRRTKKRSLPNLHTLKVRQGGRTFRDYYCTKCLRIVKKELQEVKVKKLQLPEQVESKETVKEGTNLPI